MTKRNYTEGFKLSCVQKLNAENSKGLTKTAESIGVAYTTLYGWNKKYANIESMKDTTSKDKDNKKTLFNLTPEEKLNIVFETRNLNENELGEYLRKNGLLSSDLKKLREKSLEGFKSNGKVKVDFKITELQKENKDLKRKCNLTEKALAEQSARIILLKKSHEIWGEKEEES